jgi:hypothetical protein
LVELAVDEDPEWAEQCRAARHCGEVSETYLQVMLPALCKLLNVISILVQKIKYIDAARSYLNIITIAQSLTAPAHTPIHNQIITTLSQL